MYKSFRIQLCFIGCISSSLICHTSLADTNKKILKIVPHANLTILDPMWTSIYVTRNHGYLIYDTLFSLDINGIPQPQMIKDFKVSDDKLHWSFVLRDDLKWHDGKPVTSEDCIASLKRWSVNSGQGQELFKNIISIKNIDDKSFIIDLQRPYKNVLQSLATISPYVPFMMPKRVADTDPKKQITDYTGSGPFIFKKDLFLPGKKSIYIKNYNYVPRIEPSSYAAGNKEAKVDEIDWISYETQSEAIDALAKGEVDYLESPDPKLLEKIRGNSNIIITTTINEGFVGILRFNSNSSPFNNLAVRRAISSVIDPVIYMTNAFGIEKNWHICQDNYPCNFDSSREKKTFQIDEKRISEAKRIIFESGYKNEPIILLDAIDMPVVSSLTDTTAQNLRRVGFNVVIKKTNWSDMALSRIIQGKNSNNSWDIFHTFWASSDMQDPESIIFSTDKNNGWFGWPSNPAVEAMREIYPFIKDKKDETDLLVKIKEITKYESNYIPVGQFVLPVAYRKNVRGIIPASAQFYWSVYLDNASPSVVPETSTSSGK